MKIRHQVCIDLELNCNPPLLAAVQGDNVRTLDILLLSGGEPWVIPDDMEVLIRYANDQGGGGEYDTLPDGTRGWSAAENILSIELLPQMFAVPGKCRLQVVFLKGEQQLSTFAITMRVEGEVSFQQEAEKYYNLSQWLNEYNNPCFSLPELVHVKVGSEFRVYFQNVISVKDAFLWIGNNPNLTTCSYDDYFSIIPTMAGDHTLEWKLFDEVGHLYQRGTLTVAAISEAKSSKATVLVIGDGTVADAMTETVRNLYTADGGSVSLVGTRGNGHEGRDGWTAKDYCTLASDETYGANPFYNNGFDFSYYMNNQNYVGLQAVVIQLGIHDVLLVKDTTYEGDTVIGYIDQMVSSILAYDSTMKIIMNLPTLPSSDGTSFAQSYGSAQPYWLYHRNMIRFAQQMRDYYKNHANVVISASNCILDTKTQIHDGIYPTQEGYQALGQRLYEVLCSVVEKIQIPLLTVIGREYVVTTGANISATSPRELSTSKCYATSVSGIRSYASYVCTVYRPISENSLSVMEEYGMSGRGVEFPVDLQAGETYILWYTANILNACVYLMKYNADTTFHSSEKLSSDAGTHTHMITPEEGYSYAICFSCFESNRTGVWEDIFLGRQS